MSSDALAWAAKARAGGPLRKLLLLVMADQADEDGRCWLPLERLAQRAEMSEPQVQDVLSSLEARGLVRLEIRDHPAAGRAALAVKLRISGGAA